MSYSIKGKRITLTRGDTLVTPIGINYKDGAPYELQDGDTVRFMARPMAEDSNPIITKDVTSGTLSIAHADTASLDTGDYFFDVELTYANGMIETVLPEGTLSLTPEADKKVP